MNVFLPWHIRHQGYVNSVLIIDNCTARDNEMSYLPDRFFIIFFTSNVTNAHQLEDMDMFRSLKAGYKSFYLCNWLEIFDSVHGFYLIYERQRHHIRGLRGVNIFGKPHFLYVMNMLK